jgi:hypothetical protein
MDSPQNLNHLITMHVKLSRVTKALKAWSKSLMPYGKLAMAVCMEVILQLETTQVIRQLTAGETRLVQTLKLHIQGLAAIEEVMQTLNIFILWPTLGNKKLHSCLTHR